MNSPGVEKVALIGARAVGKTTLGRALAARLQWQFIDTDEALGQRVGQSPGAFLAGAGEAAFRAVEEEVVLAALVGRGQAVVALGGGAVTIPSVQAALRRHQVLAVHLRAPLAVLVDRQVQAPRPPLTDLPLAEEVARLLERRRAACEQVARIELETFPANVDACCASLLATIGPLLLDP